MAGNDRLCGNRLCVNYHLGNSQGSPPSEIPPLAPCQKLRFLPNKSANNLVFGQSRGWVRERSSKLENFEYGVSAALPTPLSSALYCNGKFTLDLPSN